MEEITKFQLDMLKCIHEKGSFSSLLNNQFPYSKIVSELLVLQEKGYIRIDEKKMVLTTFALKKLEERKKFIPFETLMEYRLPKSYCLNIDDIYIPDIEWEVRTKN